MSGSPLDEIRRSRVVVVLRAADPGRFADVTAVLAETGLTCVEVSLSSGDALPAIRRLAAALPAGVVLGAGTVLDADSAAAAVDAGASYLVSPAVSPDVVTRGAALGVPVLAGAYTPSEVLSAWRAGAAAVKVFPAALAGGPAYVAALRAPLPDVPLVPTGGVSVDDAADYLRAGATAVGIGGPLLGDAAVAGDLAALRERAQQLVREVRRVAG